jgi:hypothetical protein
VNSKNIVEKYEVDITKLKENEAELEKKILDLEDENLDLLYFNLEHNDDALSYFERDGYDTSELIPFFKDELYTLNEGKGDHPLVPYASMTDNKMLINKVRLLNHKWIIADFSDGQYWGEMLLTYEITEEKQLKFKVVESLLYPPL